MLKFAGLDSVNVSLPQPIPHDTPFLTPEEITRFVDAIKGTDIEIVCLLGLSSMRASEAHALHWEDVDMDKRLLYVRRSVVRSPDGVWIEKETNKNVTSNRVVPIMMDNLYDALKAAQQKDGHVVTITRSMVNRRLAKACAAAGVTDISFHGLRHSFASLAAHIGMPEAVAMQIGGWADDKIMKRIYTHVLETDVNRYQNEMSEYYNLHTNLRTES